MKFFPPCPPLPLARLALVLWLGSALAGCSTVRGWFRALPPPPASTLSLTPAGPTATDSGAALVPASVTRTTQTTSIPFPAGTTIAPAAAPAATPSNPSPFPAFAYTLTAPAAASVTTVTETATAARNYAPPAPPTPAEEAAGSGVKLFYWLAAGCAAAALLAVYGGHLKAAGILAAGAAGIPCAVHFISEHAAGLVTVAVICAAGGLVAAWEFVKDRIPLQGSVPAK